MYEHLIGTEGVMDVEIGSPTPRGTRKLFRMAIRILDVRRVFGRTEFLVRPAHADDTPQWVSRDRVRTA